MPPSQNLRRKPAELLEALLAADSPLADSAAAPPQPGLDNRPLPPKTDSKVFPSFRSAHRHPAWVLQG